MITERFGWAKSTPRFPYVYWSLTSSITTDHNQAKDHGNEPSRGAKIDAQIQAEEEEELRRKGKA